MDAEREHGGLFSHHPARIECREKDRGRASNSARGRKTERGKKIGVGVEVGS